MSTLTVAFLLYLFTRIGAWASFFEGMFIFSCIVLGLGCLVYLIWFLISSLTYEGNIRWHKEHRPLWGQFLRKVILPIWAVLAVIHLTLPDQRDMMLIVGGALGYHGVVAVVSDERVQETGGKAFELMNVWLDEQIRERRKEDNSESEEE